MSYIKHPLVGDMVYGPKKQPFNISGQLLHAKVLGFVTSAHRPLYGNSESFRPQVFDDVIKKLESNL